MTHSEGTLPRLALVDWGVGGFGVRERLRAIAPDVRVTYVSDSGAPPYGTLTDAALRTRLGTVVDWLARRGVERVLFACNAASTTLTRGAGFALPVQGMIDAGVQAVLEARSERVGVVGGLRTVRSRAYPTRLQAFGIDVRQRVAQPLSAAIEAGRAHAPATEVLVRDRVAVFHDRDAVLLACTHYPAALPAFERALPGIRMIDPAATAARALLASGHLQDRGDDERVRTLADAVFTTGDPAAMRRAARAAFGVALPSIGRLTLERP